MALSHFPIGRQEFWVVECDCCGAWATEASTGEQAADNAKFDGFRCTQTDVDIVDHCGTCVLSGVAPEAPVTPELGRAREKFAPYYSQDIRKAGAA